MVIFYLEKFIILYSIVMLFKRDFLTLLLKKEINIGNPTKYSENYMDFSEYSTTIKPIALYNIDFNIINQNKNIFINNKKFNKESIIIIIKQLKEHINFAKSHGIYGFAFYYSLSQIKNFSLSALNIFIQNKNLKINFLIIFKKNKPKNNEIDITNYKLFDIIIKYAVDKRYIKFFNKYVIGLNNGDFNKKEILIIREAFKINGLGEIFIISQTNNYKHIIECNNVYDGFYYSPKFDSLEKIKFHYNKTNGYFYTHLIYHNLLKPPLNNSIIFRVSIPLSIYPIIQEKTKSYIYWDYSPEKYYFLNRVIINWTKTKYNIDNQFIFIEDFNRLQKDNILGYANINSFSKALYNLPFISNINENFNLNELKRGVFILIQVHIFYIDLLSEIIEKTNNIPAPFDLYITTDTLEKKQIIDNDLKLSSKANKYQILITPNKGRDVIPCLIQLKDILIRYKYLCHIHTKKHGKNEESGRDWQHYLYENLLGNPKIIKQILSDFENHNKLGFIFPDHFFDYIHYAYDYKYLNWYHLNRIFDILFPDKKLRAGNIMNFPVGNMFWARTYAIHQIFDERIIKLSPEENDQKDETILHAIERFWLYLVKLNGFNYKTILYYI